MSKIAVVGGGWAGLAAAVAATEQGHALTLIEIAPQLGGRARSIAGADGEPTLDNGQHILIGAYRESLALMRRVGVDPAQALQRLPLRLRYPDHEGLALPPGEPQWSFVRGVLAHRHWPLTSRLRLLATALRWRLGGFDCAASLSVAQLCASLPRIVKEELVEPLCVAALNTPAERASARVFLRVLGDALFGGAGGSDLLLPRRPLSALLAEPAGDWLRAQGAEIRLGSRAGALQAENGAWRLDGERFDKLILACPAGEAARLAADIAPAWAAQARALRFEPIVTVYLHSAGSTLPAPMLALRESAAAPAQFAFDLGQLGQHAGLFAFVISGAAPWVERGLAETGEAVLAQAMRELGWARPPRVLRVLAEKRATFACTPGLQRPAALIAPGLWAAGDHVAGPYPATLEGAVRSGLAAAAGLGQIG
ncbi:hydroxysqualene dehydroxylase HpnE [Roseateles violae]|uniref:Hydroxysqualene dehydroxylase HpnE n=1 Tax=Roseateles violae TaxID=3058042 RepID=A0ABT8DZK0_9BURK|nr:hydroxysqualene dehydroxylase HpnE [Pelomonas sp. PFR6]MDN3922989.1 hydroxysqualene dehydroxylase HpnE [Pelomonas sp. PFR6]